MLCSDHVVMDHLHLPPALIRPPTGNQPQAGALSSAARINLNLAGFIVGLYTGGQVSSLRVLSNCFDLDISKEL